MSSSNGDSGGSGAEEAPSARYVFSVMQNNWYGRKQERELHLFEDRLERVEPLTRAQRASHSLASLQRVVHSRRDGTVVLHFDDASQEHYQSSLPGLSQALVDALQTLAPHLELTQVL